ncbi:MAG: enoyl-CoA hydratase/isomerase family protein [Planctomycetaceae bacterium]|nr:enoyl-CoA hydratase/isomerase family protein [Planctomycetaceae bacterium]
MTSPAPLVDIDRQGPVTRLILNRPEKRNALSRQLIAELTQAVTAASQDPELRVLVLTARGPVFCAGMDLAEMQERAARPESRELWREDTEVYHRLLVLLLEVRVPVVAVLPGPALAGGLGVVLACDLVLAADSAFFSLPEPKRGITAAIVSPLLAWRVGVSQSSWLLLSGHSIDSAEAHRHGLCHQVVSADELAAAEESLVRSILSGSPAALAVTKQQLQACSGAGLLEQLESAREASATARETSEAREGLAAFLEKRPPAWQPRTDSSAE